MGSMNVGDATRPTARAWTRFSGRGFLGAVVVVSAVLSWSFTASGNADDDEVAAEDADDVEPEEKTGEQADEADDADADGSASVDDANDVEESEEEETGPRVVAPNRHLDVKARSLRLTNDAADRLLRIAERYHGKTNRKLVVTGGDRDAERQATLMYKKLHNGEDLIALYARDDLVKPIVGAYRAGKDAGQTQKAIVASMTRVIEAQIASGQFISRHLNFTAADIRSRDMRPEHEDAFKAAVKAEAGVRLIDERNSAAPCFHLSL